MPEFQLRGPTSHLSVYLFRQLWKFIIVVGSYVHLIHVQPSQSYQQGDESVIEMTYSHLDLASKRFFQLYETVQSVNSYLFSLAIRNLETRISWLQTNTTYVIRLTIDTPNVGSFTGITTLLHREPMTLRLG